MTSASILIRSLNESAFLTETLEAIFAQGYPDFEVILVDSGSTDATLEIARRYPVRLLEIARDRFTYGRALNMGCRAAESDHVVLLSAHALPASDAWLRALIEPFEAEDVAGVMGRELPRPGCNPFDRRGLNRRYDGVAPGDVDLSGGGVGFGAANAAVRRSIWQKYPFDEELSYAEDHDWAKRVVASGSRLRYQPEAAAYHSHNETLGQIRRRFYNEASAERRLGIHGERYRALTLLRDAALVPLYDAGYVVTRFESPRWILFAPFRRWAIDFGRYTGYRSIARDAGFLEATFGRIFVRFVDRLNRVLNALSPTLVRWTRKSNHAVHPKHLLPSGVSRDWFLPHIPRGARLLDAGCGHGAHALTARAQHAIAVGFDQSRQSLGIATARARSEEGSPVFFQLADAEKPWPYRDGAFDRVLALDILEHVRERSRFLSECRRVLRADGRLLVAVPNRGTTWRRRLRRMGLPSFSDPDHKIEYNREELEEELAAAGFCVESCSTIVYDTPWYGVIDFLGGLSLFVYGKLAAWKWRTAAEKPEESNGFRVVASPTRGVDDAESTT